MTTTKTTPKKTTTTKRKAKKADPKVTKLPPAIAKGADSTAEVEPIKRARGEGPKKRNVKKRVRRTGRKTSPRRTTRKPSTAKGRKPSTTKARKPTAKNARKASKASTGPIGDFKNTDKIKILAKKNPHRPGTEAAKRFACLKTGMTVEKALAAMTAKELHNRRGSLRRDFDNGHIKIGR